MQEKGIFRKMKNPYKLGHRSKLKMVLDKRGISITKLAYRTKEMSHATVIKHQHAPEKYTVEQISEIASLIGISTEALMVELGLISVPVSYDLVKDVYIYA